MNKKFLLITILLVFVSFLNIQQANAQVNKENGNTDRDEPADEATLKWGDILADHVSRDGEVSYKEMLTDERFGKCMDMFDAIVPEDKWSDNRKMAFWINLYNIHAINLVLENFPIKSINDVDQPWDQKVVTIDDTQYSLNDIENKVLRKEFKEPRIHFAINCASISCPKMSNTAYTPNQLDILLDKAVVSFLSDDSRNKISEDIIEISPIFDWFSADFTKGQTVLEYINKYTSVKINADAKISYMEYDWSLNIKK